MQMQNAEKFVFLVIVPPIRGKSITNFLVDSFQRRLNNI